MSDLGEKVPTQPDHDAHDTSNIHDVGPEVDYAAATIKHIPRALIIEDDIELAELIMNTLERMNIMSFHEKLGADGLSRSIDLKPALVLLDINLPDTNGWKVLDLIKEARGNTRRPAVIVITAYSDPANRLMGKLQGVEGYLLKPFLPREVEQVVREVLGLLPGIR